MATAEKIVQNEDSKSEEKDQKGIYLYFSIRYLKNYLTLCYIKKLI